MDSADIDAIYKSLRQWLNAVSPSGFRETEKSEAIELLKYLFKPEEARMALHLGIELATTESISEKAGTSQGKAEIVLDSLYLQGLIRRHIDESGKSYAALAFFPGMAENLLWVRGRDKKLAGLVIQALQINGEASFNRSIVGLARTIPVGQAIPVDSPPLPYEDAAELIKRAPQPILVFSCMCRIGKEDRCSAPLEVCMAFGDHAQYYLDVESKAGRKIDIEEALAILKTAADAGLIHQTTNYMDNDPSWLCNCCSCCCINLGLSNKFQDGRVKNIESSSYTALVDSEQCTGCGLCIDKCPVHALQIVDGKSYLNQQRCIGCGQCVTCCAVEALRLIKRCDDQIPHTPKTFQELINRNNNGE